MNTSTSPKVQYAYNEMSNGENNSRLVSMTYPNGRVVNANYNTGQDDTMRQYGFTREVGEKQEGAPLSFP